MMKIIALLALVAVASASKVGKVPGATKAAKVYGATKAPKVAKEDKQAKVVSTVDCTSYCAADAVGKAAKKVGKAGKEGKMAKEGKTAKEGKMAKGGKEGKAAKKAAKEAKMTTASPEQRAFGPTETVNATDVNNTNNTAPEGKVTVVDYSSCVCGKAKKGKDAGKAKKGKLAAFMAAAGENPAVTGGVAGGAIMGVVGAVLLAQKLRRNKYEAIPELEGEPISA